MMEKRSFSRCFNRGNFGVKNAEKRETRQIRVHSRANISGTTGRIDMGSTPVCRELIGLANWVSFGDRRVARALLIVLSMEIE